MRLRFSQLSDLFALPRARHVGLTNYRRTRLIVSFAVLASFWCFVYALLFGFAFHLPMGSLVATLGGLSFFGLPWVLRVAPPLLAGNFLILAMFGLIAGGAYTVGGWSSPLLIWYALVPALAAMVTSARWSVFWIVVVLSHLLALFTEHLLGFVHNGLSTEERDILGCVSIIGFMTVLVNLNHIYERFEQQTLRKLRRTNRELANARDRALDASLSKTSFLANMSHEFRTPLNAIIGYSELLLEEEDPSEQMARDLKRIRSAGSHLLQLVNGLLDLSKIEAGKMEIGCESFFLGQLLDEIEGTIKLQLQKNSNRLVIDAPPNPPAMHTDVMKLKQCLLNLLSNSCKFTENGEIRVRAVPLPGNLLRLEVSDTGIGMTPEQQVKVFAPFTQADASIARKFGGTGLGLTISERYVRLLGGQLQVTSELGKGSTFSMVIPCELHPAGMLGTDEDL